MAALPEKIKAMKCEELGDWLIQTLDDDAYKPDVEKLIAANINGKQFLNLRNKKDLLSKLGLSPGGEDEIMTMVDEINAGTFELPQAQEEDMPEDLLWCSTIPPAPGPVIEMDGDEEDGRRAGYMKKEDAWPWQKYPKLLVKFVDKVPAHWTVGNGDQMNKRNILDWANTWSERGGGGIPRFDEAKPGEDEQIRIQFNNERKCSSAIGWTARNIPKNQPTMHLDLHKGGNIEERQKKRHVIHEFGHVLGLRHEHQRSDFWVCISDYIDKEQMKRDTRANLSHLPDEMFQMFWNANFEVDSQLNPSQHVYTQYDPTSIMHYPFCKDWLTEGYHVKSKVETDRDNGRLKPEVAAALLGVHERDRSITYEPSDEDIETLQKAYSVPPPPVPPPAPAPPNPERPQSEGKNRAGTKPRVHVKQSDAMASGDSDTDFVDTPEQNKTAAAQPMTEQEYNVGVTEVYLSRMEWIDKGQKKVVSIYDESSYKWREIGVALGLKKGVLDGIGQDGHDVRNKVIKVLGKWYENARGLPHADQYPKSWRGLINLLNDSGLGELAEEVHKALLQQEQPRQSAARGLQPAMQQPAMQQPAMPQPAMQQAAMQQSANPGSYLTDKDLRKVNNAVLDAQADWYNIGLELDIPVGQLDGIKKNNPGNVAECLRLGLQVFLRQVNPEPSWKRLADALASPSVGRGDIARELRKKYPC